LKLGGLYAELYHIHQDSGDAEQASGAVVSGVR
jgi:hypothetical protein